MVVWSVITVLLSVTLFVVIDKRIVIEVEGEQTEVKKETLRETTNNNKR